VRRRALALVFGLVALPCPALADGSTATPRVSLHLGLGLVLGPEVTTNGRSYGNPYGGVPGPSPEYVARFDLALHPSFMLGVEARALLWTTDVEDDLGYGLHTSGVFGLIPAYRIGNVDDARSEAHFALPIGIVLDDLDARRVGPRAEHVDSPLGFQVGLVAGYQRRWEDSSWGHVFEAGVIYHRLTARVTHPDVGEDAVDEVVYQPISFFVRAGLVVYFGR
jgi:hypothetical protein